MAQIKVGGGSYSEGPAGLLVLASLVEGIVVYAGTTRYICDDNFQDYALKKMYCAFYVSRLCYFIATDNIINEKAVDKNELTLLSN